MKQIQRAEVHEHQGVYRVYITFIDNTVQIVTMTNKSSAFKYVKELNKPVQIPFRPGQVR